jgi:hypothetical protein
MKVLIGRIIYKMIYLYEKLNYLIMTVVVLGILDMFVYYEFALSLMTLLAPEIAPLLIIVFIWIIYKGIRKYYKNQKDKKYSII